MGFCVLLARQCERQDLTKEFRDHTPALGNKADTVARGWDKSGLEKWGLRYQTESQGI